MIPHKDSSGQECRGCGPECEQAKLPHVPAGLDTAVTGCCAMRFGHGAFVFDDAGNCIQEACCCAGKECGDETPQDCDAHAPKPYQVVEVRAPFVGGRFAEKKAGALLKKVRALSARDAEGKPTGPRVADAGLTFEVDDRGNGQVIARITALEKRVNPNNPDLEWHHVQPTKAEVAAVQAALGVN